MKLDNSLQRKINKNKKKDLISNFSTRHFLVYSEIDGGYAYLLLFWKKYLK